MHLNLLHPVTEQRFKAHSPEHHASYHTQQDATNDIDGCDLHAKRTKKHCYGYLVDQRRSDEKGESDTERYASFDEADEQGDGRTGAERGDGSEDGSQQVLQPIEPMCHEIVAQSFNREIGIHHAHQCAYDKEQQQDLHRVVDEEVEG